MAIITQNLLPILNQTALQQDNPRLYQVLQELIRNLHSTEKAVAPIIAASSSGGGGGGGTVTSVTGTPPISSSGGTTPDISLDDTAVVPATYGNATHVGQFTVDQKGRITGAADIAITFPADQDYVVLSDGVQPPTPVNDGAGNFIYVAYTP